MEGNKNIVVGAILITAGIVGYAVLRPILSPPTRSVTTVGSGIKQVQASKASITFAAQVTDVARNNTVNQGEKRVSDVLKDLEAYKPTDVRRTAYQLTPVLRTGVAADTFQYVAGVQMTVEGQSNIENTLKVLNDYGMTVAQVRYLAADEKTVGQEVRMAALDDARMKAEQIAKASGAKVGKVLAVSEQGANDQTGTSVTSLGTGSGNGTFSTIDAQAVLTVTFELR